MRRVPLAVALGFSLLTLPLLSHALPDPHSLEWPAPLKEVDATLGQYQGWDVHGYYFWATHFLTEEKAEVRAPISGVLNGGWWNYGSSTPDGKMSEVWLSWDDPEGEGTWFTLYIEDAEGYRWDFGALNPETLTDFTRAALQAGGLPVTAGELLGQADRGSDMWVALSDTAGRYLNAHPYFKKVEDQSPPVIDAVFGHRVSGAFFQIPAAGAPTPASDLSELVVAVADRNPTSPWFKFSPPARLVVRSSGGASATVDFSQDLYTEAGEWRDIRDTYLCPLQAEGSPDVWSIERCTQGLAPGPGGRRINTLLFRIPVAGMTGELEISAEDQAGNRVVQTGWALE
jgi:hypothetical protein